MNQQNTIREEFRKEFDFAYEAGDDTREREINWWLSRTIPTSSLTAWIEEREKFWQRQNTYEGDEAGVYRTTVSEIFKNLSTFIEGKK